MRVRELGGLIAKRAPHSALPLKSAPTLRLVLSPAPVRPAYA